MDSPSGYGSISRALHWGMAILFFWQFTSAILRVVSDQSVIYKFFWPSHSQLGFALLVLVLLRAVWWVLNIDRRPPKSSRFGKVATFTHLVVYTLMFLVPALAMLRTYGNGRGFSFLGIQLFEQTGVKNDALTGPGNALHGLLGWILLAVIIGHVLMALAHHFLLHDDTLLRMTSRRPNEREGAKAIRMPYDDRDA